MKILFRCPASVAGAALMLLCQNPCRAQVLPLKEAISKGVANYGLVKAKGKYALASREVSEQVKRDYLPNFNLSAQQDYGTINGQNGPLYGLGGLAAASSGLPLPTQNWHAAFGALYLVNVNWELFNFGRKEQRVALARMQANTYQKDYEQEIFQHQVKIAAAYLNLLASQRLVLSQQKNLERNEVFQRTAAARVKNGLLPGVDSTLAAAEVSRARISLNQIREQVKLQNNDLNQLMGDSPTEVLTDTTFINTIPKALAAAASTADTSQHPARVLFKSRIAQSVQQEKLFRKENLPSFTVFGVYQARGSGFNADYATDQNSFSHNYIDGIKPTRQNYLLGAGLVWNITSIARAEKKISYQHLVTQGLEEEYKAIDLELRSREDAANARIDFALQNYYEAPLQVKAAQQAYVQRLALYNNGLTTLTDVTTALYTLNRAETDRDIAFANVWQALLMKSAATGDFNLFIAEF